MRLLAWAGERLNPILIKETRQALKSKQFVVTFGLLLLCGWLWSIVGLAIMGREAAYGVRGAEMFAGYYLILAFPLVIIVPFGAFRALAVEQEDRTYELLSITGLTPRQIVSGKLGSSVVEMMIYLSAIAPCLAFTYMLRGISFPSILFALFFLVLTSLAFSVIGLLIGTLASQRHWQVMLSVLLVVGLSLWFWLVWMITVEGAWLEVPFGEAEFWQIMGAVVTGYVTYFLMVFYAAVSRITFASDNRSTRLRVIMVLQYVCFVGWMTWGIVVLDDDVEILFEFLSFVAAHWYVMGTLMTGESPTLSLRVRRQLPQSFLGRTFLTWFNPGPGTGYMLAVCGTLSALVLAVIAMAAKETLFTISGRPWCIDEIETIAAFGSLLFFYVTIYLGLGLLTLRFLKRFGVSGIFAALLVQVVLALIGIVGPLVIQMSSPALRDSDYTLLQISNPFWTLDEMSRVQSWPPEWSVLLGFLGVAAAGVFLVNLPNIAREVRFVRIARPSRVVEEDTELAAQATPPVVAQTSPWDE